MAKEIYVTKASGESEQFSLDKLKKSLSRAHATSEEINAITEALLPKLYEGITTKKIYSEAFSTAARTIKAKSRAVLPEKRVNGLWSYRISI